MSETGSTIALQLPLRDKFLVGCPLATDDNYTQAGGVDVSAVDFAPSCRINSLIVTDNAGSASSGNIALQMENGGVMTIPVAVAAGDSKEICRGYRIEKILTTGTTFNGLIFPIY